MPIYSYSAKSLKGEMKSGEIEAKDESSLAKTLRSEGFILVRAEVKEEKETKKSGFELKSFSFLSFFSRVSLVEKMMFTRNLQVMVTAGLPLPRAIATLSEQAKNQKFRKALLEIREEVNKGESFSESLKKHPDIFSEMFHSMIKVGEESGTLEQSLKVLTRQMEREHELNSKIKGALIYPAVIISAMVGIGILMLIMVVPKLAETFKELNIELPLTTRVIIGIGSFLASYWYLIPFLIIISVFLFWRISKIKAGKILFDKMSLKLPIFSPLIKKINSAYTVRTLSSLISAGIPIVSALQITSQTLGNLCFRDVINLAADRVSKGEKLSETLQAFQNIYPSLIFQMVKVGEETGETSTILVKLADFFEDEVANSTKNLTTVIEPVLMLVIGGAIGFFAISMVQPMYSMLGAL